MWKAGMGIAIAVFGVSLFPSLFLVAETTCGGILVEEDYNRSGTIEPNERSIDPFSTCEDRDTFATFFGRAVPSDISITWGEYTLSEATTLSPSAIALPLLLGWTNLPTPPGGCGAFNDECINGLAIEVFHRKGDMFRAHWYGEYRAPNVYGSPPWSVGQGHTYLTSEKVMFDEEGEYYLMVTRPGTLTPGAAPTMLPQRFAGFFTRFVPAALAYDGSRYGNQVIGGIRITVQGEAPHEPTFSYPIEAPYNGVRGVASGGPDPERGLPADVFTFKLVVERAHDEAHHVTVSVRNKDTNTLVQNLTMQTDTSAQESLRDEDVTNGEQYVATASYPKGNYSYRFSVVTGEKETTFDPITPAVFQVGYSSVAFIPGFQASTLSLIESDGSSQDVWPPGFQDTPTALSFTEEGIPRADDTAYVDGLVRSAYGLDIYGDFTHFMDGLVNNEKIISEWKPLLYDWRFDAEHVATQYVRIAPSEQYRLHEAVRELAAQSDSGRVTIVTHSNGGLVAKALLQSMGSDGSDTLVDQLIMVAPPQLGTPKAIASVLHGEGQGIPFHFGPFLSNAEARAIGRTLPGAYGLLPSREYFNAITDPVVQIEDGVLPGGSVGYDNTIDTFDELQAFLKGSNRSRPDYNDTLHPERVISKVLSEADELHSKLDPWEPPAHIKVTTVVGWGLDTIKGVRYVGKEKQVCHDSSAVTPYCEKVTVLDYEPIFTVEGDGTVVWKSAKASSEEEYYVRLRNFFGIGVTHADILAKGEIQQLITRILKRHESTPLPNGVTRSKQNPDDLAEILRVSVHSPVTLSIEDPTGGRVGITREGFVEESIPGGYYLRFGEGQYAGIPKEGEYTFMLEGAATGTFTLAVEEVHGDIVVSSTTFKDIPVTERTSAELNIINGVARTLNVDSDGDGAVDLTLTSAQPLSFDEHLFMLQNVVKQTSVKKPVKLILLAHVATLKHLYKKGNLKELERLLTWLDAFVNGLVRHRVVVSYEGAQLLTIIKNIQSLINNNQST